MTISTQANGQFKSGRGGVTNHFHIAGSLEQPNVTVRITTFDAGQHEARRLDTFDILSHPWGTPTVCLEGYGGTRFISEADEVAYFVAVFNQAADVALSPDDSVAYIREMTTWRKSTYSNNGQCVELADLGDGRIGVRDSKLGEASPVLTFSRSELVALLAGVKDGQFNDLAQLVVAVSGRERSMYLHKAVDDLSELQKP